MNSMVGPELLTVFSQNLSCFICEMVMSPILTQLGCREYCEINNMKNILHLIKYSANTGAFFSQYRSLAVANRLLFSYSITYYHYSSDTIILCSLLVYDHSIINWLEASTVTKAVHLLSVYLLPRKQWGVQERAWDLDWEHPQEALGLSPRVRLLTRLYLPMEPPRDWYSWKYYGNPVCSQGTESTLPWIASTWPLLSGEEAGEWLSQGRTRTKGQKEDE